MQFSKCCVLVPFILQTRSLLIPPIWQRRLHRTLAGPKQSTHFALTRMRNELLNQCTPREKPGVAAVLLVSAALLVYFYVDGPATGLEAAESRIVHVWVDQARDNVINHLQRSYLMLGLLEELLEIILENARYFDPRGQHYHRHYERLERLLALSPPLALEALLYLCDLNEKLLQMELVQRLRIDVPKNSPVS